MKKTNVLRSTLCAFAFGLLLTLLHGCALLRVDEETETRGADEAARVSEKFHLVSGMYSTNLASEEERKQQLAMHIGMLTKVKAVIEGSEATGGEAMGEGYIPKNYNPEKQTLKQMRDALELRIQTLNNHKIDPSVQVAREKAAERGRAAEANRIAALKKKYPNFGLQLDGTFLSKTFVHYSRDQVEACRSYGKNRRACLASGQACGWNPNTDTCWLVE